MDEKAIAKICKLEQMTRLREPMHRFSRVCRPGKKGSMLVPYKRGASKQRRPDPPAQHERGAIGSLARGGNAKHKLRVFSSHLLDIRPENRFRAQSPLHRGHPNAVETDSVTSGRNNHSREKVKDPTELKRSLRGPQVGELTCEISVLRLIHSGRFVTVK